MSECAKAIKISGADIVTVAVRRVNISDKKKPLCFCKSVKPSLTASAW